MQTLRMMTGKKAEKNEDGLTSNDQRRRERQGMQLSRFFAFFLPTDEASVREGAKARPISVIATVLSKKREKEKEGEK